MAPVSGIPASGIIDVHAHALLGIGRGSLIANPATTPRWSLEETLAIMDDNSIAATVLSVPDNANHDEGNGARDIARRINDKLADIVSRHPRRFTAVATVPGRDIDATLREMEYALDTLDMDGVATSTNIADVYLGDARFDPWFDEMNRRRVTLFVHPMNTLISRPLELGINAATLEFVFDTTRMIVNMVVSGAKRRFADVSLVATHAGGVLPLLARRVALSVGIFGNDRGYPVQTAAELQEGFTSFHYDLTASTTQAHLIALTGLVPTSHILFGFDAPYMPRDTIAPATRDILGFDRFGPADIAAMAYGNASRLFPKLATRLVPAAPDATAQAAAT